MSGNYSVLITCVNVHPLQMLRDVTRPEQVLDFEAETIPFSRMGVADRKQMVVLKLRSRFCRKNNSQPQPNQTCKYQLISLLKCFNWMCKQRFFSLTLCRWMWIDSQALDTGTCKCHRRNANRKFTKFDHSGRWLMIDGRWLWADYDK